jgi:hypothetical protein
MQFTLQAYCEGNETKKVRCLGGTKTHAQCLLEENFSKADNWKSEKEIVIWATTKTDLTKIHFDI